MLLNLGERPREDVARSVALAIGYPPGALVDPSAHGSDPSADRVLLDDPRVADVVAAFRWGRRGHPA
jgi:hypothetical protein